MLDTCSNATMSQNNMLELPIRQLGAFPHYKRFEPNATSDNFEECLHCHPYIEYQKLYAVAKGKNIDLSITLNESANQNFAYLAWCDDCQDGVNANNDDANDWVRSHAKKRHMLSV